ncbi:hypothetical protein GUITHDRAFT_107458 [Guillardia theta CCMP2712]|uniref:RNA helicase n=1 Tax=Guillardia theta (strain CCMP2712) TaxID=905079 RepID=L1JDT3_GUITC|nr:hypothetical protein GUITHDRAFT_107458 [Guillardia theta CCMP2712]EKX46676.1 hypothetical protein GUITHDRAFT_107458 [Guillardia theta CCMP2712]|eukprot:XP_005833656.1 hypothetical protein GUITHDRAFT_107458 [Guillardia theta CCMP2712]
MPHRTLQTLKLARANLMHMKRLLYAAFLVLCFCVSITCSTLSSGLLLHADDIRLRGGHEQSAIDSTMIKSITQRTLDTRGKRMYLESRGAQDDDKPPSLGMDGVSPSEYRSKFEIQVKDPKSSIPLDPIQTFAKAPFAQEILTEVRAAGFQHPSPIQAQCWPYLAAKRDLVAVAKTGSGKTCGYLFCAFMKILKLCPDLEMKRRGSRSSKYSNSPVRSHALVLAPTRELVVQITAEAQKFGKSCGIVNVAIFGGVGRGMQMRQLNMGAHLIIATPGRLNDFIDCGTARLDQVEYVVLDEADRMLDMGFEPQIKKIFKTLPAHPVRQTITFTATWPKGVQKLAATYLHEAVQVNVGGVDELIVNSDVVQEFHHVRSHTKEAKLLEVLQTISPDPSACDASIIIFVNTKRNCDLISRKLRQQSWRARSIHGGKLQDERLRALNDFTSGRAQVIVATDVAARGLDIKGVSHVINFDLPSSGAEDWVHRVGRTGRAGAKGHAHTFICDGDAGSAGDLIKILTKANQPIPDFLTHLASLRRRSSMSRSGYSGRDRYGRSR